MTDMTLRQKQSMFAVMISSLILWADEQGMEVTFGEVYRSDEQAEINAMGFDGRSALVKILTPYYPSLALKIANNTGNGVRNTLHSKRLAVDLNLFIHGVYQVKVDAYFKLGQKWKQMHKLNRWGGDFSKPDAFHFSMEHEGVQ